MPRAIKLAANGDLDILAIPFGGPLKGGPRGKDTDGDYFSERTELCLDWFPTQRPLLYDHGFDEELEATPVGTVDVTSAYKDDAGWWVRAQLNRAGRYWQHIRQLIEADDEGLFASSGAMPHLIKRAKDGEILRWPWVELSLTMTPANFFAVVQPAAAKAHYKAAGLTPPPTIDADDTRSYADLLDRLTDDVGDFTDTTRRLTLGRVKVGRPISAARRQRLSDLMARMRESADEIASLLDETDHRPETPDEPMSTEQKSDAAHAPAPDDAPAVPSQGAEPPATAAPSPLLPLYQHFMREERHYAALLTGRV